VTPYGIDCREEAVRSARLALPTFARNFVVDDLWSANALQKVKYEVVLLSLRRLQEANRNNASTLLGRIFERSSHLLLYAYADRESTHCLAVGAARFGLSLRKPLGEAALVGWGLAERLREELVAGICGNDSLSHIDVELSRLTTRPAPANRPLE
jgi:hypothetical protein